MQLGDILKLGSLILALAVPALAHAEPVSVAVGQTKRVTLSVQVARIDVSDKEVLSAKKLSRGVEISGSALGKSELKVTTAGGDELTLVVHVTNPGSRVF